MQEASENQYVIITRMPRAYRPNLVIFYTAQTQM